MPRLYSLWPFKRISLNSRHHYAYSPSRTLASCVTTYQLCQSSITFLHLLTPPLLRFFHTLSNHHSNGRPPKCPSNANFVPLLLSIRFTRPIHRKLLIFIVVIKSGLLNSICSSAFVLTLRSSRSITSPKIFHRTYLSQVLNRLSLDFIRTYVSLPYITRGRVSFVHLLIILLFNSVCNDTYHLFVAPKHLGKSVLMSHL